MIFDKKATSIEVVRKQVNLWPERARGHLLARNPYLSMFVNDHSELFTANRTLTIEDRRVRGEYAGAVMLKPTLPTVKTPQNIAIALPVRGTHDNRAYVAASLSSEIIDQDVIERQDRKALAHEVASVAIFGYLNDEIEAQKLFAEERRQHLAELLWRRR